MESITYKSFKNNIGKTCFNIMRFQFAWLFIIFVATFTAAICFSVLWIVGYYDNDLKAFLVSAIVAAALSFSSGVGTYIWLYIHYKSLFDKNDSLCYELKKNDKLFLLICLTNQNQISFSYEEIKRMRIYRSNIVIGLRAGRIMVFPNNPEILKMISKKSALYD